MSPNHRSKIDNTNVRFLLVILLITCFGAQTGMAEVQVVQQTPNNQQPAPPKSPDPANNQQQPPTVQAKVDFPLPVQEDDQIKQFDGLPKTDKELKLIARGPLFPKKYSMSNLSMRAFVKGGWPLIVDYALQPGASAMMTISVADKEPFSVPLEGTTATAAPTPGNLAEQFAAQLLLSLIEKYLKKPETSRKQKVIQLPDYLGEHQQVGKIVIQAYTEFGAEKRQANLQLYGLGMGTKAVVATADASRRDPTAAHHYRPVGLFVDGAGSLAIDQVSLNPKSISFALGQKVKYKVHSRSAFFKVAVIFNIDVTVENVSWTEGVYYQELGAITENGWLEPPRSCTCVWNGANFDGNASRGSHNLEVRAWVGESDANWVTAWSNPKKVQVR